MMPGPEAVREHSAQGRGRPSGVPGVIGEAREVTPLLASSSVSALGTAVMTEVGRDCRVPPCVPYLAPPAWAKPFLRHLAEPAFVVDRAVLCLFQDSPIPNLTLSQDMERMAWTTG